MFSASMIQLLGIHLESLLQMSMLKLFGRIFNTFLKCVYVHTHTHIYDYTIYFLYFHI